MLQLNIKYREILQAVSLESPFVPDVSIVLGSGLGDFAASLKVVRSLSTEELPGFPASGVEGHRGRILFAEYMGKNLLIFQGRIHFYEGHQLDKCLLSVLISHHLGSKKILLTNAAGGINADLMPGDLMLNTGFNAMNIKKELTRVTGLADYERRQDFADFPDEQLAVCIRRSAEEAGIKLKEGVYWYCKGPSYETPAEIRMIRTLGGDAVGMSTVYEALYAAWLGMEVASVSCITNFAAGISPLRLSHDEVTVTANSVRNNFERLIKNTIQMI